MRPFHNKGFVDQPSTRTPLFVRRTAEILFTVVVVDAEGIQFLPFHKQFVTGAHEVTGATGRVQELAHGAVAEGARTARLRSKRGNVD
jgi:hypothetical protein